MSMYLAVAVETVSTDGILALKANLIVQSADEMPIGAAGRGKWPKAGSVLVQDGADSSHLFGVNPKNDRRGKLYDYLKLLLDTYDCEVAFIFHTFRGTLVKEQVKVQKAVRVPFVRLKKTLDKLEEDVRYVVFWHGWPPRESNHDLQQT